MGSNPAAACAKEMEQIKAAGGDITFLSLPDVGIKGSTHMFMQGKENIKVADVLIDWIDNHVDR
ncbi:hypothetical protein [Rhizobium sp. G21]|nr:hypothetical protein [Rhizobium sp. G21]MBB1249275.1 hypothetical protein [Rhizobium sp. G21]